MILVDSCGWLEYLSDGKRAEAYAAAVKDVANLLVPTVCIYEVFRKLLTERGEDAALTAAAAMTMGRVVDLTLPVALVAARIGTDHKIPFADSVILATARAHAARVYTQDGHFRGLSDVEFIE